MSKDALRSYLELSAQEIRQQLTEITRRHLPEPGRRQVPFNTTEPSIHALLPDQKGLDTSTWRVCTGVNVRLTLPASGSAPQLSPPACALPPQMPLPASGPALPALSANPRGSRWSGDDRIPGRVREWSRRVGT
jgi:hypothetical protein